MQNWRCTNGYRSDRLIAGADSDADQGATFTWRKRGEGMSESYPFSTYSGLLEPKHYKRISSAIWLFLWCISSTTKEEEIDGVTWGIVLGNKPMKIEELKEKFDVSDRTIRSWIKTLEEHGYIHVTRAPYGLIFKVKNSKRYKSRSEENYRSLPERPEESCRSDETDRKKVADHPEENCRSNKDIIKILNTTTTDSDPSPKINSPVKEIENEYYRLHGRILTTSGFMALNDILKQGIPPKIILDTMSEIHAERTSKGQKINCFSYYKDPVCEAWERAQLASVTAVTAETTPSKQGTVAPGLVALSGRPRTSAQTRLQANNERLLREIWEAENYDGNRGQKAVFNH